MIESLLPELQDPQARQAVIESIQALFARWHLHNINQARLLGLVNISVLEQCRPDAIEAAVLNRIGNLLAIDRALNRYFKYEPEAREKWIFQPHRSLNGETPLAVMLSEGDAGIRKIRRLAEYLIED